jgi:hypothetical protein
VTVVEAVPPAGTVKLEGLATSAASGAAAPESLLSWSVMTSETGSVPSLVSVTVRVLGASSGWRR